MSLLQTAPADPNLADTIIYIPKPAPQPEPKQPSQVHVREYLTLMELAEAVRETRRGPIILVIDEWFSGNLWTVLRCCHSTTPVTVVALDGKLPGIASLQQLRQCGADVTTDMKSALASWKHARHVTVCWPQWRKPE